jgi:hypothetical protein
VTNHDARSTATAVFSNVRVVPLQQSPWLATDVGKVGIAGASWIEGSGVRIRAAGGDIWNTADAFHFVWQTVDGDVDIVARLASVGNTHAWAKAGVMIRARPGRSAPHAFMLGSAGKGSAFQRRSVPGGPSTHTPGSTGSPPVWLRLTRRGDLMTAYESADGISWTPVGSEVVRMGRLVFVGLAVSSHTTATSCEAVFEEVRLSR